ncbi:hypothetical protein ACVUJJ_000401 [Cronobacter turicensis]
MILSISGIRLHKSNFASLGQQLKQFVAFAVGCSSRFIFFIIYNYRNIKIKSDFLLCVAAGILIVITCIIKDCFPNINELLIACHFLLHDAAYF